MATLDQDLTSRWAIYNGDCVEVMQSIPDKSIHFSVYSPPFGGLYAYSSSDRDMSNCVNYDEFLAHYKFAVEEIHRVTMPGRCSAVHCCDVPLSNSGKDSVIDLPGHIIKMHADMGWHFTSRVTIWKEPLWIRRRTLAKDLFHRTLCEDSAFCGIARADYILFFRKAGNNPAPVEHPVGLLDYAGESEVPADLMPYRGYQGDQTKNLYSHWIWRQYASCVWDDIRMGRVLPFKDCKEEDDEKHVHPLQLDVIERLVTLKTNPNEVVLTPFMGVGSEVYGAVINGRKGRGIELKTSYYRKAKANLYAIDMDNARAATANLELPFGDDEDSEEP
jgi:DNA modification methylase